MHEAKRELERLGAGLDAEYMQRLSETFHPYKQTVAETIVQDTRQDSTYALRARLEVNSVATSIAKLFVPVEVVRRRARDLRKLIQKEGFCHGHALELIAKLFGFDGYSQLHRNAPIELMGRETLAWDENLSADELASRYSVQAELLSRVLELDGNDARSLLEAWRPTAILDAYEELRRGAPEEVDSGDSEDAVRENTYASTKPIPNDSIGKRPIVTIKRHRHIVRVEDGASVTPHLAAESRSHG
ncbi:hypothetical protein G3N59_11680 [Paraburkholderia sp. Ac-20340]|nr:hypothetical protein [Paraburkholderia sp. Ac-20340]